MNIDRREIRPIIEGIDLHKQKSVEEQFQNEILRPIIKMQHDLLVAYFKYYLLSKKCKFNELVESKRLNFITAAFQRDNSFKAELKGIVIGQFTITEFDVYARHKNDFNKRILTMIQQRIISVLELF